MRWTQRPGGDACPKLVRRRSNPILWFRSLRTEPSTGFVATKYVTRRLFSFIGQADTTPTLFHPWITRVRRLLFGLRFSVIQKLLPINRRVDDVKKKKKNLFWSFLRKSLFTTPRNQLKSIKSQKALYMTKCPKAPQYHCTVDKHAAVRKPPPFEHDVSASCKRIVAVDTSRVQAEERASNESSCYRTTFDRFYETISLKYNEISHE